MRYQVMMIEHGGVTFRALRTALGVADLNATAKSVSHNGRTIRVITLEVPQPPPNAEDKLREIGVWVEPVIEA